MLWFYYKKELKNTGWYCYLKDKQETFLNGKTELWAFYGETASGKNTFANSLLKDGLIDEIVSIKSIIAEVMNFVEVDSNWNLQNIQEFSNFYRAILNYNKRTWVNFLKRNIESSKKERILILDCCTKNELDWFLALQNNTFLIILSPDIHIREEWFGEKYNKSIEEYRNMLSKLEWNKDFIKKTYSLMHSKRKKMAAVRFGSPNKETNCSLIREVVLSLRSGEPSKLW
jgi:hypothetical protein